MLLGDVPVGDLEVKADEKVCMMSGFESACPLVEYFQRTSSWHWLRKSVAWLMKYRDNLRRMSKRRKLGEPTKSTPPRLLQFTTVSEMEAAELEILKNVQLHHFPEEIKSLGKPASEAHVKKSSCLRSLDPILVDGLLRVSGRLSCVNTL